MDIIVCPQHEVRLVTITARDLLRFGRTHAARIQNDRAWIAAGPVEGECVYELDCRHKAILTNLSVVAEDADGKVLGGALLAGSDPVCMTFRSGAFR